MKTRSPHEGELHAGHNVRTIEPHRSGVEESVVPRMGVTPSSCDLIVPPRNADRVPVVFGDETYSANLIPIRVFDRPVDNLLPVLGVDRLAHPDGVPCVDIPRKCDLGLLFHCSCGCHEDLSDKGNISKKHKLRAPIY